MKRTSQYANHRFPPEIISTAVWIEQSESGSVTHHSEPGSDSLLRAWIRFLGLLPIEWMLYPVDGSDYGPTKS